MCLFQLSEENRLRLSMKSEVPIRLVLIDPPAGVDFGIQRGRGAQYEAVLYSSANVGTSRSTFL